MIGKRALRGVALFVLFGVCLSASGCISVYALGAGGPMRESTVAAAPGWFNWNKVAICDITGFIGYAPLSWRGTSVADFCAQLDMAAADSRVKAVILRIDSPGGEVSASDIMYEYVQAFQRDTGKPVVACITGMGASGAYYIALASETIICHPTAITGSVGVLLQHTDIEGLYTKLGLKSAPILSGSKKDMGSATRPMRDDERQLFEAINRDLFDTFVRHVRARRPMMTDAQIDTISDGRILTARQALGLGMIDRVDYMDAAVAEAERLAGIKSAKVVIYQRGSHSGGGLYAEAAAPSNPMADLVREGAGMLSKPNVPSFYYLWTPTR